MNRFTEEGKQPITGNLKLVREFQEQILSIFPFHHRCHVTFSLQWKKIREAEAATIILPYFSPNQSMRARWGRRRPTEIIHLSGF